MYNAICNSIDGDPVGVTSAYRYGSDYRTGPDHAVWAKILMLPILPFPQTFYQRQGILSTYPFSLWWVVQIRFGGSLTLRKPPYCN